MPTPRAVLIAIWIFCINACFAIFNSLDPFGFGYSFGVSDTLINQTANAAGVSAVSGFGIAEAVMIFNLFINLLLGPLTLVPDLLSILGVVGLIQWILVGCVWFIYAIFLFQILTGRIFKVIQ